jgi:parvulin-like peptidyl-prolyl isomerase
MRCAARLVLMLVVAGAAMVRLHAQEIVDRIAARVENDIILMSDVRALRSYQQFVDGKSESDAQILERLIDQWIVRNEAAASHFPRASEAEVAKSVEGLQKSFSSPEEYAARKKENALTDEAVRHMIESQLYLSNYLDSRFRPAIQIEPKAVEEFYQTRVVPRAQAGGLAPATLDAARDYIQEFLVQQAINEHTDQWLKESRARLHVEKLMSESAP